MPHPMYKYELSNLIILFNMKSISEEAFSQLITRLENAVNKLENKTGAHHTNVAEAMMTTEKIAAFTDYWNKTLKNLLDFKEVSKETGMPLLEQISEIVCEGICAHQDILIASEQFKKPVNNDLQQLSKKLVAITTKLQDIGKANKEVAQHCEAVKNGLDAMVWLFQDSQCDVITQTYFEAIDFAGNKIMMKKNPPETKWVKSFKAIIKEIDNLVKANYKSGLVWSSKGDGDVNNLIVTIGNTYRTNFKKQSNCEPVQEETKSTPVNNKEKIHEMIKLDDIRKNLKPVKKDECTTTQVTTEEVKKPIEEPKKEDHKCNNQGKGMRKSLVLKKGAKEEYQESRSAFIYENLEDQTKDLDPEKLSLKTTVQISNCFNSTFKVSKKVNFIKLTNCENVNVICDTLVSICEIINCVGIKVQVTGTVRSFSIDGSENILLHLGYESREAQVVASKSSDMKLRLAKEDDSNDYDEIIIPEQFVFTITPNRKIAAKIGDNYGY
jgi:adenylyl cyclase-associated protein